MAPVNSGRPRRLVACLMLALLTAGTQAQVAQVRPVLVPQIGHIARVNATAFSGDGRLIATGCDLGAIRIWDADSGRQLWALSGHDEGIQTLRFSGDGRWLASSSGFSDRFQVKVWDLTEGREVHLLVGHEDRVQSLSFSSDGSYLATASEKVRVWNTTTGTLIGQSPVAAPSQSTLAFSPDGEALAVREPQELRLVRRDGQLIARIPLSNTYGRSDVVFRADGARVATVDAGVVKVWDVATRQSVLEFKPGDSASNVLGVDGDRYALRIGDRFEVWNGATRAPERVLATDIQGLSSLSPDWRRYTVRASGSAQTAIAVGWTSSRLAPTVLGVRAHRAGAAVFSSDATRLATQAGKRFWLWPLGGGEPQAFDGHDGTWPEIRIDTLAFLPDGQTFISADWTGKIVRWNLPAATAELPIEVPIGRSTRTHDVSANGRWLVSATAGRITVFELPAWKVRRTMTTGPQRDVVISGNGRFVAAASVPSDPIKHRWPWISLWDVESGEERVLTGHRDWVTRVAFDAAGRLLASSDFEGTIKVWDVQSGRELYTLDAVQPDDPVWSLAFSPGGGLLAAGAPRNSIVLWDLSSRRIALRLHGHHDSVGHLNFSTDGRLLASATSYDTRVWDVERGRELVMLVALESSKDWLAVSPDGRYDGSEGARRTLVGWRVGSTTHPVERYSAMYYTPGLLNGIFRGQKEQDGRNALPPK